MEDSLTGGEAALTPGYGKCSDGKRACLMFFRGPFLQKNPRFWPISVLLKHD
jgi:hypothetical protein